MAFWGDFQGLTGATGGGRVVKNREKWDDVHTAPMGWRYPYELEQRKESYFPLLWCIVMRKQALVFLKTYGLKNYRSLTVLKLASFHCYSPWAFLSNWSIDNWFFLIKTMKENHKPSFETICIDVWSFWDFSEEDLCPKYGQFRQKLKKLEFEASRDSVYWFKMLILIKTVEEHHKLSFETICIDVWSFWSFLVAKKWLKIGPNWSSKLQKNTIWSF